MILHKSILKVKTCIKIVIRFGTRVILAVVRYETDKRVKFAVQKTSNVKKHVFKLASRNKLQIHVARKTDAGARCCSN